MKIEQLAIFRQGLEAMSEALRNQESSVVAGAENLRVLFEKRRRALAQIHGNIEHLAAQAAHDLGLGMGRILKV